MDANKLTRAKKKFSSVWQNRDFTTNGTTAWREFSLANEESLSIQTKVAEQCQDESLKLLSRCLDGPVHVSRHNLCAKIGAQYFQTCTTTPFVANQLHLFKTGVYYDN